MAARRTRGPAALPAQQHRPSRRHRPEVLLPRGRVRPAALVRPGTGGLRARTQQGRHPRHPRQPRGDAPPRPQTRLRGPPPARRDTPHRLVRRPMALARPPRRQLRRRRRHRRTPRTPRSRPPAPRQCSRRLSGRARSPVRYRCRGLPQRRLTAARHSRPNTSQDPRTGP